MSNQATDRPGEPPFRVSGFVRYADGLPASRTKVVVFDRDLRNEQQLNEGQTNRNGRYQIEYSARKFLNRERGTADLVVKVFDGNGSLLAASPVLFNAPQQAEVNLTIPLERQKSLIERIDSALEPLLSPVKIEELEENDAHRDLTFLSGETGFERGVLARYILAHHLAGQGIDREFWFALLGGSFFDYAETESLKENLDETFLELSTLDARDVRHVVTSSFNRQEIPASLKERTDKWVDAFLDFVGDLALGTAQSPSFARMALEHARIEGSEKRAKFARLLNQHKALTSDFLEALQKDGSFQQTEIADLRTSFQLAELTRGDFSVVGMLKDEFNVRRPEQIRSLAKQSEGEWVALIERKAASINVPLAFNGSGATVSMSGVQAYARALESQFRDAFPTAAFAGGLERALGNGGVRGMRHAMALSRIIERHIEFDLLHTSLDQFLNRRIHAEFRGLAGDQSFRLELKAVQRVFKLAPTFEATDALLADGLHSAQTVYRLGESEFMRRYANRAGFTRDSARLAWNRAADTHAAVVTVVGDLKALDPEGLPIVLRSGTAALSQFPNWQNLFQSGDLCHCEQCRSVLSPAAYFTDLLMFLRDRRAANPAFSVKDVLFRRRPDLGYLELNCENAMTLLPYVDIVCEILESAIAAGENDTELTGFTVVPAGAAAAKAAVGAALTASGIGVGADFTLSQVDPADPDRWVVHGDDATYLLKKKATANFFAELLPNTKASSAELRAYPAYVNPKAYEKLRAARYPMALPLELFPEGDARRLEQRVRAFGLPFDLFAEEVRAAFQKCNLQRWDLMRTLRGNAGPNNPTDGEIAAEYFGISCDASAPIDEKRLILQADATATGQQAIWGEQGNAGWLNTLSNVRTFLWKTGLEYEEMLALFDLPFINPARDIAIQHQDASCDTDKKVIQGLDATKLDRIHRFLRLQRKLSNWKMWELDLTIRSLGIGGGTLDEAFLIQLYHLGRLRTRLGARTTVAQLCALFDDLSTETVFTKLHAKRADGLYQSLFLNKRLLQPLDPAFDVAAVDVVAPTAEKISGHHPIILAALGISETDLGLLSGLTQASNGAAYITDDLTLTNLSFLWRHAWLAKLLKLKVNEWQAVLKLLNQDVARFSDPKTALEFVEKVDHLKATGFTLDELNWILAADRAAKAAINEADAARFLTTLRTQLQALRAEFDPAQYDFLNPPSDVDRLSALLTSLLQRLHRDEAGAQFFVGTLMDEIIQERAVPGLPAGFTFPVAIAAAPPTGLGIRISYEPVLRFSGVMTPAQRTILLNDPSLAAVTALPSYQQAIQHLFENHASAPVALPAGFALPPGITGAPNNILIRYDPLMRFTGLMTTTQQAALLTHSSLAAVTGIAAYQQAIDEFFQAPRLALKFLDPVFTAPLANLPVDFNALPNPILALRMSYDAEERFLRVVGILSMAEKAALDALSADPDYRNAVNALFTQPRSGAFPPEKLWLQDSDLQFPLRDLNDPANDKLRENLSLAITKALAYHSKTLSEGLVVQQASAQVGLTEGLTRRLLTDYAILPEPLLAHLTGPFADSTDTVGPATLNGWFWAHRVSALWKSWNLTLAEWERVFRLTGAAQLLDFASVPLNSTSGVPSPERFLRTRRLLRFRESLPETGTTFLDVLVKLMDNAYGTQAEFAEDVQRLNEAWTAANVADLINALDLAYPNDYLLAETWERLRRAFYFVDSLNGDVPTLKTFGAATMGAGHAGALKALLRSKFGVETWLTLSAEIQDVLRERKRDALAAYLLTNKPMPADAPTGKWENTNDLYAYYLLDVEMGACQLTSRLVQASGSVQLFVQRCFMGLEPDVKVQADGLDGDTAWRWWKVMRKYRVWEANLRVFLTPEHWIRPELKKDRSTFFKELENELLQNEINEYTVETAFANYLQKLDSVAQLEIAGFYQEDDGDNTILHVFGRTTGTEPHVYYYRRYDYRQWTPWEKVDVDIQGDYLIPAVVNGRLFLFWPVFTEVSDETENNTVPTPDAGQASVQIEKAWKKLRLQMAVSDYRQGKWTPKRVSKQYDQSAIYRVEIVYKRYVFTPIDRSAIDGRFGVQYEGFSADQDGVLRAHIEGAFEISGCDGVPQLATDGFLDWFQFAIRPEPMATGNRTAFLKWEELVDREDQENDLALVNPLAPSTNGARLTTVLNQTPGLFRVSPPLHLSYLDKLINSGLLTLNLPDRRRFGGSVGTWVPFFYNDRKRTFFVLPALSTAHRDDALSTSRMGEREGEGGGVQIYYPDIKRKFRQQENFYEGQIRTSVESFDLAGLSSAQREQLEATLASQISIESEPPFSDQQVKDLLVRFFMRFVHRYLGLLSLQLFEHRKFHFKNFYHPFVCDFAKLVQNPLQGIPGLMKRETQLKDSGFSFLQTYQPTPWVVDPGPAGRVYYPKEVVDFSPEGAFSPYNYEAFLHGPLLIANALRDQQAFALARDWYHYIFNPIGVESTSQGGSAMSKYWITKPFFETTDQQYVQQRIDSILRMLAGDTSVPGYSPQLKKALEDQVFDWRTNPFEPHRIANYRTVAYQKTVVMAYLDNLIAWGDYLFRQDSMESINEATQLYILAAEILGPRPRKIPPQTKPALESFNELENQLGVLPNALVEVENLIPLQPGTGQNGLETPPLPMLYFCIPQDDKMLGYWDTIADRLYKVRHCMNIEGVVRQLALFEPPIDPGALVKAVAAGVDIGAALADLNAPLPIYRFNVLLHQANEVCNDAKALAAALLSALEKKDAEALGLLRQKQEIRLLEAVKGVREKQIDEAKEALAALKGSKELTEIKKKYYESREFMNSGESLALALSTSSAAVSARIALAYALSGGLRVVPQFIIGAAGFGGSPTATAESGGRTFGEIAEDAALTLSAISTALDKGAAIASTVGGFQRRQDDWDFQKDLATKELDQIESQIAGAELRIAIGEKELENHLMQIENAKAIDAFMRLKYTNEELYQWQVGQISGVYFQSYKLAYDLAKRAERSFRFELGLQDASFISFGYWDSLKKGLLAGEKLQYDLRRLESAYLDQNRREFEVTKHVSLAQVDPLSLVRLRETGRCFFRLPEEIFDLDYPGHYFRRIKSVSITLPCVAGPYTTISCTLRLLKNSVRINTRNGDSGYPRNTDDSGLPADDLRFVENNIPVKAIAASSGQNDSGMFELFRDERYLPFEGAGVISEWLLELFHDLPANNPDPANPDFGRPLRLFDYATITDAVLHVKYTAREDAGPFKNAAVSHLRQYLSEDGATPSLMALNLRRDFPTQWSRFLYPTNAATGNVFEFEMSADLFPMRDAAKTLKVNAIHLLARCTDPGNYSVTLTPPLPVPPPAGANTMTLSKSTTYGGLHFAQKDVSGAAVAIVPTDPSTKWNVKMTRPGGGNLIEDPVTKVMEVEDAILVLGYEWE